MFKGSNLELPNDVNTKEDAMLFEAKDVISSVVCQCMARVFFCVYKRKTLYEY